MLSQVLRGACWLTSHRPRPMLACVQERMCVYTGVLLRPSSSWSQVLASKVVAIDESDLEEKFVKGSGNGGQKINKVRNSVFLKHIPTGLFVQCQKTRSLDDNRRVARKLLHAKLDDFVNGTDSKRNLKIQQAQKKKAKKKAKSRQKHLGTTAKSTSSGGQSRSATIEDDDDFDDDGEDDDDYADDEDGNDDDDAVSSDENKASKLPRHGHP